jgi:flagellar basal-body rod modification protein FlgD
MAIDPTSLAANSGLLNALDTAAGYVPTGQIGQGSKIQTGEDKSDVFGLGQDDFFKLFLAQLKNQDPTKPMDDKEFVAQLAQFSMIDTMKAVQKALTGTQLAQASGLIGKHIIGHDTSGQAVDGIVDRVVQDEKGLLLVVGSQVVDSASITSVDTSAPAMATGTSTTP